MTTLGVWSRRRSGRAGQVYGSSFHSGSAWRTRITRAGVSNDVVRPHAVVAMPDEDGRHRFSGPDFHQREGVVITCAYRKRRRPVGFGGKSVRRGRGRLAGRRGVAEYFSLG
jgi:hypothetical protein